MIDPAVLDAMLAAGCTADQIVAAVKADAQAEREREEARREAKRAGNAERQRRHRERNALSRVTGVTNSDTPSPEGSLSPEPPILPNPQPSKEKSPKGDQKKGSPRQALLAVLDAERADAVLEHRQRMRKPLTTRAAALLAAKFALAPDPNGAADAMIENGWQGFDPAWLANRQAPRGHSPPPRDRTVSDVLGEIAAGTWTGPQDKNREPDFLTIDASYSRRN